LLAVGPGWITTAYDIAEIYDRARALLPATALLWQELLADYIDPGAAPLILDLGCGTGRFSELLARRFGGQVIGIDPSERHSARIAARRSIRPFRASRPAIRCASAPWIAAPNLFPRGRSGGARRCPGLAT
jgi:SAM-dependent methyltransferase